jgi:hypothetical protein
MALAAEMNGSVDNEPLKEWVLMGSVWDRGKQSAPQLQKELSLASSGQTGLETQGIEEIEIEKKSSGNSLRGSSGELAGKRAEENSPCSAKVDEKRRILGKTCGGTRNPRESRLGWGIRGRVHAHSEALPGALKRGFESFSRKALRVGQRFIISALPFRRNKRFDEHGR